MALLKKKNTHLFPNFTQFKVIEFWSLKLFKNLVNEQTPNQDRTFHYFTRDTYSSKN